mmetsp:Transcript_130490/g.278811  ORF Transcript_130490/g.278811 Transcript_130490/m.278811 type:complete len:1114 (+) Transcript_130490:110-3451(+)
MNALENDGKRVRDKLAAASPEKRAMLQRTSSFSTMPVSQAASKGADSKPDTTVPSLLAGLVHGTIVLMSFTSFAVIIFGQSEHAELRQALSLGISQQLLSAGLLIGILTFTGFFPFTMGGPTPPAALLVSDVVRTVVDGVQDAEKKVPTAMFTIALVTLLSGAILMIVSVTKTSVYALQLPYPVLCGFLGSVGVLLMRNAVSILIGAKLKWVFVPADWGKFQQLDPLLVVTQLVLGLVVAALLLQGVPILRAKLKRKAAQLSVLPCCFLAPVVVFFVVVFAGGLDLGKSGTLRTLQPPWLNPFVEWEWSPKTLLTTVYDVPNWDMGAVFNASALLRILVAATLCVIAGIINMAGIEANAPQEKSLNLDAEFMSLGRANIFVGLLGGHPGHHVAAFSLPMKKDGGTRRLAPWTAAGLWLVVFLSSVPLGAWIPCFFLGGCFLQVGFGLARTFLWDNRKGLDLGSKVIAWVCVLAALMSDLNTAAGVGFALVALNFMRLSMNASVVRAVERADTRHAPKYRRAKELSLLQLHGHRIMVLYLEAYLFWGTVDEITAAFADITDGTEDDPEIIFVDMRYVTGIELSVINTFKKLHRLAANVGIRIVLCSLPQPDVIGEQLHKLLGSLPFASKEGLTSLLEKAEDQLLQQWNVQSPRKAYTFESKQQTDQRALLERRISFISRSSDACAAYWQKRAFECWRQWCIAVQQELQLRRSSLKQAALNKHAATTGSCFAMQWELVRGQLHVGQTFYPPWRSEALVRHALESQGPVRTFVTSSARKPIPLPDDLTTSNVEEINDRINQINLSEGVDFIPQGPGRFSDFFRLRLPCSETGQSKTVQPLGDSDDPEPDEKMCKPLHHLVEDAWCLQKPILCVDVKRLPEDAFSRKTLALEFGVSSLLFVPTSDGVIELGVTHICEATTKIPKAVIVLEQQPAELLRLDRAELLASIFRAKPAEEALAVPDTVPEVSKHMSWDLILALGTLGTPLKLDMENSILAEPAEATPGVEIDLCNEFFIVMEGMFGTFKKSPAGDSMLLLKSTPGSIIGAEDAWAQRPRSVSLRCLSEEGMVVVLSQAKMKQLEMCDSPFISPGQSEEFIEYMKKEMSLNQHIMGTSFSDA